MLRLKLEGFEAFTAQLKAFPADLEAEASAIVHDAAELALRQIQQRYPIRTDGPRRAPKTQEPPPPTPRPRFKVKNQMKRPQTPPGALRAGMRLEVKDRPLHPRVIVRNTNPLAHIFEDGTEARHTALGAYRGTMPPGHVFIPVAIQVRRTMNQALVAVLEREDFEVTGA